MSGRPDKEDDANLSGLARAYRNAAPYINSSYVLIAAIALCGWLGWLADSKLETKPVIFIIGLFVGLITGFYSFYKIVSNVETDK